LCRVELFQYTKDPIALLEGAKAGYPIEVPPSEPEHSAPTPPAAPTPPSDTEEVPSIPSLPSQDDTAEKGSITLSFDKVDLVGKEFVNKRDISVEKNFGEVVKMDDELLFTVKIKHKITGEVFHGTLSQPILLIASNTHVSINPVSTVLVSHGVANIKMTPKTKGSVYIAINLGTTKIGGMSVSIQ
jgi:hypothetical protein